MRALERAWARRSVYDGCVANELPHPDHVGAVTEAERQTIRDAVLAAMVCTFGVWNTSTKKVFRWEVIPGRLHAVLLDSDCGTVVVPFRSEIDKRPYFGEVSSAQFHPDGKPVTSGRHSNVAPFAASVGWDRDVLYLRPMTRWELEQTVRLIEGLKTGRPIEDARPPHGDVPLASLGFGGRRSDGNMWSTYRAVYHRDEGRCQMCGATTNLHLDHKIPRAKGGSDTMENLWLLCVACNLSKSDTI